MESNYLKWMMHQHIRYRPSEIISALQQQVFTHQDISGILFFDEIFLNTLHDSINYLYILNTKLDKQLSVDDIINKTLVIPLIKVWWIGNLEPNLLQTLCIFIEEGYVQGACMVASEFFTSVVGYLAEVSKKWVKSYRQELKILLLGVPKLYPYFRKGGDKYISVIKCLEFDEFELLEYEFVCVSNKMSSEVHLHKLVTRNWYELCKN